MNKTRILTSLAVGVGILAGVSLLGAYEAHIINVTAHIENALAVTPEEIDFGTVFPQESNLIKGATIGLSQSFLAQDRVKDVHYTLTQKTKSFVDWFSGASWLDRWVFVNDGGGSSASVSGGWLTLTAPSNKDLDGDTPEGYNYLAPRLVVPATQDFTIETRVQATPNKNYEGAGLLVYQSDGNLIRLELAEFGTGSPVVYMEGQENYVKTAKRWTIPAPATDIYLKIVRTGNLFRGQYSSDGSTWNDVVGNGSQPITNNAIGSRPMVGVAAVSSPSGDGLSAKFNYFKSDVLPTLCPYLTKKVDGVGDWVHSLTNELEKGTDESDNLEIRLDVPCISGYCEEGYVGLPVPGEDDYGCDIWIEVTGFSY